MTTLLAIGAAIMISNAADSWLPLNDGVMGGVSSGGMIDIEDGMQFRGTLSLANNGGFSSVRHLVTEDLSNSTGIRLTIRGDGRSYQFRIRQDGRFDGVAWRQEFQTDGSVQMLVLNYPDFVPVWRGRQVRDAGSIDSAQIQQLGFMIADKQPGDFSLSILKIELLN